MSLAILNSRALIGLQALPVRVEVHLASGLPAFNVVGLPDTGVRESRERVRAAIVNSGFEFPAGRLTVNLAPADLPKESSRFDLAIAIGVLLASGQLGTTDQQRLKDLVLLGELSLTGALVASQGALAIALSVAQESNTKTIIFPWRNASEASFVSHIGVLGARSLAEVVAHLNLNHPLSCPQPLPSLEPTPTPCLSDVKGQASARRALEVAAAGRHSLLLIGCPGTGKSMLAQRMTGILPPLDDIQSLEAAAIAQLTDNGYAFGVPPFRSPHHSSSSAALVGGGLRPKPGEMSMAHHGVLFLDELPEFNRQLLESLREPLETGYINISRAAYKIRYPANVQLIAAMNPCHCGWLGHPVKACLCSPDQRLRYKNKLSGPLLDRIDIHLSVPALSPEWVNETPGESSEIVQQRVYQTRLKQLARQGKPNAELTHQDIDQYCLLSEAAKRLWHQAITQFGWSGRTTHRVLKVARTLADMEAAELIEQGHIAEAIQFKRALP